MRKLPLEETHHAEIDDLLNDPDRTRRQIARHEQDFHPRPLHPITEETVQKLVYAKHDFFNCYYYGLHALEGLPEPLKDVIRRAALIHVLGEENPEKCAKFAQVLAKLFQMEAEKFLELARTIERDGKITIPTVDVAE